MRTARLLLVLLLLLFMAHPICAQEDTGTYKILSYVIKLTPHSDGKVDIDYYQKWLVTGGHIPWITVGLPNDAFQITDSGLAVKSITAEGGGGWSGVRIDLDKDYQANQTFEVKFSVKQSKLFYADENNYKLDFTPGWYDRAPIESLEIRLKYFAKPETIQADPQPTAISEEELSWVRTNLGEGEKFPISISFPKAVIPNAIPADNLQDTSGSESGSDMEMQIFLLILAIIIVLKIVAWIGRKYLGGYYTGGSIFYGGRGGSRRGEGSGRDIFTGGGGGFGGGGFSCACACVSCACACACAGGGGAGCSRKVRHRCSICRKWEMKHAKNQ